MTAKPESLQEERHDLLEEMNPDILVADGLEGALIGYGGQFNQIVAVYSVQKVLAIYEKDGMSHDEAREHFDFNVAGSWVGDGTPIFVELFDEA